MGGWIAAYMVHWRRIRWQVEQVGFLSIYWMVIQPATICHGNGLRARLAINLFFNRENLERYGRIYCRQCPYTDIVTLKVAMKNWAATISTSWVSAEGSSNQKPRIKNRRR